MPRKVKYPLDNTREDIQETRVWKVLEKFVYHYGGNGLTANALCYLTQQPWSIVRGVLTKFKGRRQITCMYCYDVRAVVFYNTWCTDQAENIFTMSRAQMANLKKAESVIRKYPWPKWQGATCNAGQKTLTYYMYNDVDNEAWEIWKEECGDPACCIEPARNKSDLIKKSKELSKVLRQVWRK